MKFIYHASLAALFGSFAVAVPANSWTLSFNLKDDLKESPARAVQPNQDVFKEDGALDITPNRGHGLLQTNDICQRTCFQEPPKCAEKWYSSHLGSCWTCCKCSSAPEDEEPEKSPTPAVQRNKDVFEKDGGPDVAQFQGDDICLRICYPDQPKCAQNWYSLKQGGCWTCCKCSSAPEDEESEKSPTLGANCADKAKLPAASKKERPGL